MNLSEKDKVTPTPLQAPDAPKNPVKPSDSSPATLPEVPKVGTKDAEGG